MKAKLPPYLTARERKIENEIVNRECRARIDRLTTYCDAVILLTFANELGWGKKRLVDFWRKIRKNYYAYMDHYEMEGESMGWLVLERCKTELGIDIEELEAEDKAAYLERTGGAANGQ